MKIIDCSLLVNPDQQYTGFPREKVYNKPAYKARIEALGTIPDNGNYTCLVEMSTQLS